MRNLTTKSALLQVRNKRKIPYKHRNGDFVLTASFRNDRIDWITVNLVGALVKMCTQMEASRITGIPIGTVSKLCRIYYYKKAQNET